MRAVRKRSIMTTKNTITTISIRNSMGSISIKIMGTAPVVRNVIIIITTMIPAVLNLIITITTTTQAVPIVVITIIMP